MAQALKRILKELNNMNENKEEGICAGPEDKLDMFTWTAKIIGPENTPYEGGIFKLRIKFPKDYPFKPPRVNFKTKIYHPNVLINNACPDPNCPFYGFGITCLDILHDSWLPNITIIKILKELQNLLKNPYLEKPMEKDIAKQYIENKREFETTAREWTKKYAY